MSSKGPKKSRKRQRGPSPRARNWCFTLNNPAEGLLTPEADRYTEDFHVTFMTYSEERGDREGTQHFQGYLEFSRKVSLEHCKTLPKLKRAHFEVRNGSQDQAIAYCNKPAHPDRYTAVEIATHVAGPYNFGTPKRQGGRTDLAAVRADLDAGSSLQQISQSHFSAFIRYERGFRSYVRLNSKPRDFESVVFLFVGPSGNGKSTLASLLAKAVCGDSIYRVPPPKGSGLYYDGYDGQQCLFFDEFGGHYMRPELFNQLCQPFPFTLPVHGGAGMECVSRYIFICSNYHPAYWWKNRTHDQVRQTCRRIHAWIYLLCSDASWQRRKSDFARIPGIAAGKRVLVEHGRNQGRIQILPDQTAPGEIRVSEKF